jgi:protein ImuA
MVHVRAESLRRLHLAAQHGETLFFLMRPLTAAADPPPAPLRLSVRPALGGIDVGFVKRQGPARDKALFLPMLPIPTGRLYSTHHITSAQPTTMSKVIPMAPLALIQ